MLLKNKYSLTEILISQKGFEEKKDYTDNFKTKMKQAGTMNTMHDKNKEKRFSISQILDYGAESEGYKKGFFVLSEDLKEEDEEMSNRLKRELLLKRIISDNSILTSKLLPERFGKEGKKKEKKRS